MSSREAVGEGWAQFCCSASYQPALRKERAGAQAHIYGGHTRVPPLLPTPLPSAAAAVVGGWMEIGSTTTHSMLASGVSPQLHRLTVCWLAGSLCLGLAAGSAAGAGEERQPVGGHALLGWRVIACHLPHLSWVLKSCSYNTLERQWRQQAAVLCLSIAACQLPTIFLASPSPGLNRQPFKTWERQLVGGWRAVL